MLDSWWIRRWAQHKVTVNFGSCQERTREVNAELCHSPCSSPRWTRRHRTGASGRGRRQLPLLPSLGLPVRGRGCTACVVLCEKAMLLDVQQQKKQQRKQQQQRRRGRASLARPPWLSSRLPAAPAVNPGAGGRGETTEGRGGCTVVAYSHAYGQAGEGFCVTCAAGPQTSLAAASHIQSPDLKTDTPSSP
jgi:hypothetical protein